MATSRDEYLVYITWATFRAVTAAYKQEACEFGKQSSRDRQAGSHKVGLNFTSHHSIHPPPHFQNFRSVHSLFLSSTNLPISPLLSPDLQWLAGSVHASKRLDPISPIRKQSKIQQAKQRRSLLLRRSRVLVTACTAVYIANSA